MAARDLGRSIKGSEECFDFNCSKCKKKSVRKAEYYCPECNAYFCKSCLCDGKFTHDVLGRGSVDKWGTPMKLVSFDTCRRHTWDDVQLYCPRQGVVCCSTCSPAARKTGATESNEKAQEKKIEQLEEEKKEIRSRLLRLQKLNKAQAEEIIAVTEDNNSTQERLTTQQSLNIEQAGQIRDLTADKTADKDSLCRMEQLQEQSKNQAQQIEAITTHLNRANDDIKKYQEELDEGALREGYLHERLKRQKSITQGLQKEVGGKDYELKELQKKYKDITESDAVDGAKTLFEELIGCKKRIELLRKESENQAQENKALTVYLKQANDDIQKSQKEIDEGCRREGSLNAQLRQQKSSTKELHKKLGKDHELKELQKEYKDLKERFGKMAGEEMKHNKPDIINLGDQNRSTKIAERYNTLYNEAWTDAWSDQTENNIPDEEATENLLQVLKYCYKYCTEHAERQYDQLSNILNNPVMSLDMSKPVRQEASASKDPSDTTLRAIRKEISLRATEQVKSYFWEQMKKEQHCAKWRDGSKAYILQCADVCWAMVLSLPPLYMEFDVKPGTKLDTNVYSKRSSGNVVKQLVWPALFNGKGGGMLAKGVVEASKSVSKK